MSVEFRLLGTVEADINGEPVDLGPARQRCVLATLLVEVNHVVPVDALLHRVWAGQQPYRARGTLYSYLSRLRNALAPAGNLRIDHRSGGYLLSTDSSAVDLHLFHELLARARADHNPENAADSFERALALWRGEAFATLDTAWLNSLRDTLEAERHAAELDFGDLQLRLGRHARLLTGLRARAAQRPLDERLAGQLMLALYRCGRQDEGLAVYQNTRTALVDELGLDPGPELNALQQRILAADPELASPAPARIELRTEPGTAPRQLPAGIGQFVGREEALEELRTLLAKVASGESVVAAIDGTAGVGKTALAVHFGHQVAKEFPDGQLHVDLRGHAPIRPMTAGEALGALLRGLGLPAERVPADEAEQAAAYRSLLAGRRVLIVLDNARSAAQVQPLLPGTPGCLVLLTSRTMMSTLDGVTHLRLEVLREDEALALLGRSAGTGRILAQPESAATVVRLCARLPLAIRIAGARLAARRSWSVSTLADRLADHRRRLDELQLGERAVRASFAVSYQALRGGEDPVDGTAARTFRLLGVLDWMDISVPVAAALLDEPQAGAHEALERLVDDHLLDATAPARYQVHDLLRLYGRDVADAEEPEADRLAAVHRALDCYLAASESANLLLNPSTRHMPDPVPSPQGGFPLHSAAEATEWTDAEHANLLAVARQAFELAPARSVRMTAALTRPFDLRGYWQELITLRTMAASAAQALGDPAGEAFALQDLGWTYVRLGHAAEAAVGSATRALRIWRRTGDRRSEQACLNILGFAYRQQERYGDAVGCLEQALRICAEIEHRYGEATTQDHLGLVHQRLHRFDDAISAHLRSLAISREIGHRYGEAIAVGNMGWTHLRGGNPQQAIDCHQHSLALSRKLGDRYQEAESLWGLGQAQHALGRVEAARAYWDRSIVILRDIGALSFEQADALRHEPLPETPEIIQRNT